MWITALVVVASLVLGCGGDDAPTPGRLIADPAVEVGCRPGQVDGTRAKLVACDDELIGGWLAAGRVGDIVLENARVRVIVRGPGEGFYQHGSSGGGIVDAARRGGDDLVKELLPLVDLSAAAFDEYVIVEAGDDGPAELVVRGPATALDILHVALGRVPPPIIVEQRYRLAVDSDVVDIETRVYPRDGAEPAASELYDGMFLGGRARAFLPRKGFGTGTGTAEMIATDGTTSSYGIVYPAGTKQPQLVDFAGVRFVLGADVDARGLTRHLVIGDGSVASVTERGWELRGVELGVVEGMATPSAAIVVAVDGSPITIARAAATGAYRVALPHGTYTLRAEAEGHVPGATAMVTVGAVPVSVALVTGGSGTLAVHAQDDDGRPLPARVMLTPRGGGETRIAWTAASGDASIALPPGSWEITITRGLEYEAFVATEVVIADGEMREITATLPRVVDTDGWIALDTHLHSELSTDSTFPVDDRLRAVAGEGIEVPVSTDHDVIVDYAPIVRDLGLEAWLRPLAGAETSSIVWGHVNGFPLEADVTRTGRGSPRWGGMSPGELFAALHGSDPTQRIVQVNHPRRGSSSFFNAIELDPESLTAGRDPTELGLPATADLSDLSFDAVEVVNSVADEIFEEVFADYLALVAAGHHAAATGASDSHGPTAYAGAARTYVYVGLGNDDPACVDPAAIVDGLRARRVVVSTGAFVTAGIVTAAGTTLPGETANLAGLANVTLRIRVQAASWQRLARIRIFEGTREVRSIPLDPRATTPVRFAEDVLLPVPAASTFWVVRVDLDQPGVPVLDTELASFTNPLFGELP